MEVYSLWYPNEDADDAHRGAIASVIYLCSTSSVKPRETDEEQMADRNDECVRYKLATTVQEQ